MRQKEKPNIVFILADDLGAWAMGCAGNTEIKTPNLDRLAREGIRFSNFFCTSPVCSPARASLLTGRMPSQHGVHDWIREGNIGEHAIEYLEGQTAYTDILANNGYYCGISGKWHLGSSFKPQKGFSHWYVHQTGGSDYYGAPMVQDGKSFVEPEYITDIITEDSISFLSEHFNKEYPFYLSVHYTAPHSPWIGQHPKEYVDMYENCTFESCPQEPEHPWSLRSSVPSSVYNSDPVESLKGYFASVTAMDANIGRIMDKLEELNILDHTVVCFFGDNGFNCGHHGIWGKGNGTLPQNMYDTSVLVPAIIRHPRHISAGAVSDELLSGYDFMPTLLEYVGLQEQIPENLPGRSFLPILKDGGRLHEPYVVVYDEYGPVRMIRTKEWKYVFRFPAGPHELYDLVHDPNERMNLISSGMDENIQSIVQTLKAQMDDWFNKYVDQKRNGLREPVKGKGQIDLVGEYATKPVSFNQDINGNTGDKIPG